MSAVESIVTETLHCDQIKVDREKGIIRGVKILGRKSGNGYEYTQEALRQAAPLYAGRPVNIDHGAKPGAGRPMASRFGKILTAEARDDGIFGDLQYNRKHPLAEMVAEAAAEMPDTFGLSHEARVKWRSPAKTVAESVLAVKSVDVVADPATTSSLFEHRNQTMTIKETLAVLKEGTLAHKFVSLVCEMEGMGAMPMEPVADTADADGQLLAGFKAAINAVVDDTSLDLAAKKAKIGELLKMLDKVQNPTAKETPLSGAEAEESKKHKASADQAVTDLQEQLQALTRKDQARTLCDAAGIKPSPVMLKALCRCDTEAEMGELIQEHKSAHTGTNDPPPVKSRILPPPPGANTPKSGHQGPVQESQGDKGPASYDEWSRKAFGRAPATVKK